MIDTYRYMHILADSLISYCRICRPLKHGWLFTGTSHRDGPTPAAAAGAVPTQTVGLGPCGPVAAGCYGASAAAAAVHSQSLRLGT